ncbi:MAG: NADH-quinone oxidoreductase subunit N [Chthoniobacteraceae bacterium]
MILPIFLEIAVLIIGCFLLLYESLAGDEKKSFVAWMGIGGLAVVLGLSFLPMQTTGPTYFWHFYAADDAAMYFKRIALFTTIVVLIMSVEYREVVSQFIYGVTKQSGLAEFYALPVLTCAGLMWMASAVDFVLIFVSLELVTISFYILVSYLRRNPASLEAGVKYLILGALSTGFLVYGITWIYGVTGETELSHIAAKLPNLADQQGPLLFGFILVFIALGFKIAAVPFQIWVPDVYQGAPTPVTAFLSVGSKSAGFIVLVRVLEVFLSAPYLHGKIIATIAILAALTLIYGNLTALPQENFKRLLAYSSIAHAGYLLVALACLGDAGSQLAINFYIAGYLLMTLLSFVILAALASYLPGDDIKHFNGLSKRAPSLAFGMLIAMLSLAGVPFTAGFLGKFLIFSTALEHGHYVLVGISVLCVASGFYYYLKIVRAIYWQEPTEATAIPVQLPVRITVTALALAIVVFGVYPKPLISMFQTATVSALSTASR